MGLSQEIALSVKNWLLCEQAEREVKKDKAGS